MRGFVHLSGEHPELALAELKGSLFSMGSDLTVDSVSAQICLLESAPPEGLADRMGLCHFTGVLYDSAKPGRDEILETVYPLLDEMDRDRSISLKVKVPKNMEGLTSSDLFETVSKRMNDSGFRVRHRDPDQWIYIIVEEKGYIGIVDGWSGRRSKRERRGSKLPFNRPIVMAPKLARAMVNISGLPVGSTILDPFLGPAGLAMEAGFLGHKVIGVERDPVIYHGARVNVLHMELEDAIEVHNGDSRRIMEQPWSKRIDRIDGIVTDPPFGRSAATMGEDPGELLRDVISNVRHLLPAGAPLVLDSSAEENIGSIDGFTLELMVPVRVHKSMTRHIALMLKD